MLVVMGIKVVGRDCNEHCGYEMGNSATNVGGDKRSVELDR